MASIRGGLGPILPTAEEELGDLSTAPASHGASYFSLRRFSFLLCFLAVIVFVRGKVPMSRRDRSAGYSITSTLLGHHVMHRSKRVPSEGAWGLNVTHQVVRPGLGLGPSRGRGALGMGPVLSLQGQE